ncbi:glycosyltransferase family 2 protein [Methanococcoides sp. FTZ1]|uniref:glycosyltransferase family 2 protein n=1 Tax=Methanococcoides sp. FTZ1 TaxID=3439061 RepID=UPI003F867026
MMSENQEPLVSICCITYNHEKYIREAIESFLMQETDFPFEILIHDDASTDNTASIVREYSEKYPNIIKPIFQKKNQYSQGVKINLTFNYPRAKGKYIAICEGDDYWTDPKKLQIQVAFLEENPDYVITYTAVEAFDENGIIDTYVGGALKDLSEEQLKRAPAINTLTTCFRNLIKESPPEFRIAKLGDLTIWSLLSAYGKGKFISEIKPSAYRVHEGGIFSKKSSAEKMYMNLTTQISLMLYYMRVGDKKTANYFMENVIRSLYSNIGVLQSTRLFLGYLLRRILKRLLFWRSN